MKILHVLSTPRAEGTPNLVLDWLNEGGHDQQVFVLNRTPPDLTTQLRARSGSYAESDLFRGRGVGKFFRIARALWHVCREHKPDIVVCWPTGFANWICFGARFALGGRVIILVHCGNPPGRGSGADWITRAVILPAQLLGAKCICCSNYVRDSFRAIPGLFKSRFQTVHNCVRVLEIKKRADAARATPHRGVVGIMVATMEAHKDHATLLRALPLVLTHYPDLRLLLVGDGALRPQLEQLARDLKVDRAVDLLGSRKDVPELLGGSDIFVFSTTEQEGFGTVLIEALAAGLKIVATDCPACRETLFDGLYGKLVPPGDHVALAREIVNVIGKNAAVDRNQLSAYLGQFTVDRMMSGYLNVSQL